MKSPLMLGTNLLKMSVDQLNLVSAPEVLAVHQDSLGAPGDLVWKEGPEEVEHLPLRILPYPFLSEQEATCQAL